MPVLMGTVEMSDLAQKLARMRFNRAKAYVRSLDKDCRLDIFRVVVGSGQWLTRYTLPNKGIQVTLIEQREEYGAPNALGIRKTRFRYVEARVEPIPERIRHPRVTEPAEVV
jgi:ribulose 1,5-bisphosphate synthetase/thiazole synthase